MKNKEDVEVRLGVAWYRREQWELLRSTASDPEILEDTYDEWVEEAEKSLKTIRKAGHTPVKVDVDVEELNRWCDQRSKPRNGDSRVEYVIEAMKRAG